MKNNQTNLLASIAVFAELCNTQTDIKSIINEFIKSVFAFEKTWALNSIEVMALLKKHFDFDIPEAVVKYCLNSLKNENFLIKENGRFSIVDTTYNADNFLEKLNLKKKDQLEIEAKLIEYHEALNKKKIEENCKKELIENFISYIMDNGVSDNYSTIISSFVVINSKSPTFVNSLNQIKGGLIQITGLKYTNDLTNLGKWNDEITIYLDTEILFNAAGFNGIVYEKLFDDFYSLIKEINQSALKKNQKKLIILKYFEETKREIDQFFGRAEKIIKREDNATPGNSAMVEICKGCSTLSDLVRKKSKFETDLKTMGIMQQDEMDYYSKPEFIVESTELMDKYKDKFEENVVHDILHSFTKINFFRRGINRTSFEKCKHIILTGKTASFRLSKDLEIKNEAKDIPFSTDIYFITNRLWFKLNKGLSNSGNIPSTLDIVIKAQVVLSSQISRSVEKRYQDLRDDRKSGNLTIEQAQDYYHNLREQSKKPEEINNQNVNESIEIIFEDDFESYLKEKSATQFKLEEGEAAKRELKKLKSKNYVNNKKKIKKKIRLIYLSLISFIIIVIIGYFAFWIYIIITSISKSDTKFTIISGLFTIALPIISLFNIRRIQLMINYLRYKTNAKYIEKLAKKAHKY